MDERYRQEFVGLYDDRRDPESLDPEAAEQDPPLGVDLDVLRAGREDIRRDLVRQGGPNGVLDESRVLEAALAADTFRFDASDLMPPRIGGRLFWEAMMTYLKDGPRSLDRILARLDARWPDDG